MENEITVTLTEDELRSVLDIVGPAVSLSEDPDDDLGTAEFKLDSALLEHESKTQPA